MYYTTELHYEFDGDNFKIVMRMRSKKLEIPVIHNEMFMW